MREAIAGRLVGARVQRVEDPRLLTGRGRYVDDLTVPGMAHAAFLRSPYPHARIVSIDVAAARALPGVRTVLTGADMQTMTGAFLGMMPLDGLYDPPYFALAVDRVRLVGDPVAIVVADTRRVAEDGCELIEVEYEALPAVATMAQAQDPSRPPIWPKAGANVLYRGKNSYGDVDQAFADADRVITQTFEQHRHSNQPMETRGSVAEIDPLTGELDPATRPPSPPTVCVGLSPFCWATSPSGSHSASWPPIGSTPGSSLPAPAPTSRPTRRSSAPASR